MMPAATATLLRVNLCRISVHCPATAIEATSAPGFNGLIAGPVSSMPSLMMSVVIS